MGLQAGTNEWTHSIPQRIRTEITHVRFGPVEIKQKSHFTNAHNKKISVLDPMECHARHTVCLEARAEGPGHAMINGDKIQPINSWTTKWLFYITSYVVFWYPGSSGSLPQESSVSRCSLFGNDHIKTFDGSFYNFAGDCSYLLAGDCHKRSFTLLGESEQDTKT